MKTTYPSWINDDSEIPDPLGYAERAVNFLRHLRHPKSPQRGRALKLDRWQERIVRRIYGPRHNDGTRVVKTVVLLIGRGNRKTSLAALLALLHTIGPERRPGGENLLAASDRQQAGLAFREAAGIIREDKGLVELTRIYDAHNSVKKIVSSRDASFLEAISGDGAPAHGRTPAFVFVDELHIWKNAELWKALKSALPKTQGSLMVVATTSGRGQENIAHEIVDRARKVATGAINDPSMLPILFETAADADWKDESLWYAANPGLALGYQDIEGLRQLAREGETSITARETFRQYNLNVWLDHSADAFVDMAIYDEGAAPIDVDALAGQPCWLGVDMSSTTDLTAVVACFRHDDGFVVLPHIFCPADNLRARAERDGVPYVQWAADGHLNATPGNVIDYSAVTQRIRDLCVRYDVREIGFDTAYAQAVMSPLTDEGLPVVTIRQGWVTQSPALNELERAIVGRKFQHGGHPVLRWCFSNVAIQTVDAAGSRKMHKASPPIALMARSQLGWRCHAPLSARISDRSMTIPISPPTTWFGDGMTDDLNAYLNALPDQLTDQLSDVIREQAQLLSDAQRQALQSLQEAPDDTGNLEASFVVMPGDGPLEFLVQAGGDLTTGDIRDGSGVPYDHALAFEFGNSRQPARPFFYPTYNAMRPAMQQAISDAIEKATK